MDRVTPQRTFRKIGYIATYSHTTLAAAAAGKKFPTWQTTRAFLIGCGAEDAEIQDWRQRWEQTQATILSICRNSGEAAIVLPTTSPGGQQNRLGQLRLVRPDATAARDQWRPRPEEIHTFDDLRYELRRMKAATGNPGLRTLSGRMARCYSTTTLSDIFTGKRFPGLDVTLRLVNAMLDEADQAYRLNETDDGTWTSVSEWGDAWNRAKFDQQRPDLTRGRRHDNVVRLADERNDDSPAATIVAEMNADVAAALLAGLTPRVAGDIITGLPTTKALAILTAMERLHQLATAPTPLRDDSRRPEASVN
ncbi:hypothetical protein ACWZHB_13650 [Nocardia sp. FBN12]|uniref:hypothetical protein n=1 Tax=Nocardia sp. FBN12 TaxID=3419766 RepID=UPI003CFEA290